MATWPLYAVAALLLVGLVAGIALPRATATGHSEYRVGYCPFPCSNTSQNVPYYTTSQFWAGIGDALIAGGIVGILLGSTVYKHPVFIVGSVFLLASGIVVAVFI